MITHTNYKGNKFYLNDDCDALLCKLENIADNYYLNDVICNIDKIELDIEKLENAIENNDINTMQNILDNYRNLFKRYR